LVGATGGGRVEDFLMVALTSFHVQYPSGLTNLLVAAHITTVNGILCAFARELPHDRCYSEVSAVKTLRRPITRTEQRLASHRVALSLPLSAQLDQVVSYCSTVTKNPRHGKYDITTSLGYSVLRLYLTRRLWSPGRIQRSHRSTGTPCLSLPRNRRLLRCFALCYIPS